MRSGGVTGHRSRQQKGVSTVLCCLELEQREATDVTPGFDSLEVTVTMAEHL